VSGDRLRLIAGVCAVLAVLAAIATAAVIGLAVVPKDLESEPSGDWGYALIPFAAAVGLGALAIALWRNSD
jgi:hypothetical protein